MRERRSLAQRQLTYDVVGATLAGRAMSVPAGYRVDATAAYQMERGDLRLNVFNLTNSTYYEQAMASDGGRTVPGTGLTAMLTYAMRL